MRNRVARGIQWGSLTVAALFTVLLAGCVSKSSETTTTPDKSAEKHFRAALVLDTGGVDDKSFNASAWAGAQRAQKELGMAADDVKYIESRADSEFKTNLTNFSTQNYDVVIAIGYKMKEALKEVAPQFPKV